MHATRPASSLRLLIPMAALALLAALTLLPAPVRADTNAPTLRVVTVDGTSMALIYNEALDTGSVPAASAYSVAFGGATGVAPSSVAVVGAKVKLTLSTAATSTDTVTVAYTKPGTNPLQDLAGNDAATLAVRAVTNNTGSTNNQPSFSIDTTTRSVAENTVTATGIGSAVTATGGDSDTLTYSLPDGFDTFTIGINTGQLNTNASLDYEDATSYPVPVYVQDNKDAAGGTDAIVDDVILVTVTVTDVNEAPTITGGRTMYDVAENTAASTVIETYTASDEDDPTTFTWTLEGDDAGDFTITRNSDDEGELKFKNVPDFENRADNNTDNEYVIEVTVSDGSLSATRGVTVNVTNVDEPGSVTLPSSFAGGTQATATLTDPDGTANPVSWQWARGAMAMGTFTDITTNGTSASYTPVAADVGNYLRATASYTDPEGSGKSASAETSSAVGASNSAPTFDDGTSATREVPENTTTVTNVGAVVTASDSDSGDTLTYGLTGTDAGSFTFDSSSGQIKTKTNVTYNYENKPSYSVDVTVRDSKDAAGATDSAIDDTIGVTINLGNVDEPGTASISGALLGGSTLTASVTNDPDGAVSSESWQWARGSTQGGSFSNISGATNASYTTTANDVGKYLRATASYTDPQGSGKSASAVSSGTVGASNSEPTFINGTMATRTLPENSSAGTNAGSAVAATDGDSDTLTYALKSGNDSGDFTIVSTSGQIQAKSGETYNYEGSKNSYTVIVTVHDGKDAAGGSSTTVDAEITVTINLTNVNEAPTITSPPNTRSFAENGTGTVVDFAASDVDVPDMLEWSVETADDGNLFEIHDTTGVLTFKAPPDFESPQQAGTTDNTYEVTVKVEDDGGLSDTHKVTVNVTNVNEAPEIDAGPNDNATINEDENTATTVIIATYEASDVDAGANLNWSLEGNDRLDFTITENSQGHGELKFASMPNYEIPADANNDNDYEVTVKVSDGSLNATRDLTVRVEDVNETPVVSGDNSPDFPEIEFDVDRADLTTANLTVPGTYTFYDDDGDDVSWSLSGDDSNHFTITEDASGNGVLTFKNPSPGTNLKPADFENPVDTGSNNDYAVTVEARDNNSMGALTGTFAVTVNVTPVDETPVITSDNATQTFDEIEYDYVHLATDLEVATFTARDEEDGTNDITWTLGGTDEGDFTLSTGTINGEGKLFFRNPPNFEAPDDAPAAGALSGDNVYEVTLIASDTTAPLKSRDYPVTVTVTDVNETPEVTGPNDNLNFSETPYDSPNTPNVATFAARDEEMQNITWSLAGDDAGDFTITKDADGDGVVIFNNPPNFEMPADHDSLNTYVFTVQAFDGTNTGIWDYAVTVTDVNERPEFTGTPETAITLDEHDATLVDGIETPYGFASIATYAASDEEGGVTWTLTGTDSGDFAIDSGGAVTFVNTPSYEAPADSNRDNVYTFTVVATDVASGTSRLMATENVTVTVGDLEEAGTIEVLHPNPGVGDLVRFELTDPDGGIDLIPPPPEEAPPLSWSIETRAPGGAWQSINANNPLATFTEYRVPEDQTGRELRAVVTYIDRRGSGKRAESEATAPITADPIVNAPPRFTGGTGQSIPEGEARRFLDDPLTAFDRDGDTLTFGLGDGVNSDFFEVNASTGQIRAIKALDFETTPLNGLLTVPVTLHDGKDADGNVESPAVIDVTTTMSVIVQDVEEDGVVTLSAEEPEVGVALTATLADGDGNISGESWQWARSETGRTWTNISGAMSNSYTPDEDDGDFYLQASVTYMDRRGDGKTAEGVTTGPVPSENRRPTFPSTETGQRTVSENTRAGVNVGAAVAADDPENDGLTYSLSGTDAADFTIVTSTGQIQTKDALNFETKPSYSVDVEVHDGRDGSGNTSTTIDDTQAVTITIENVEEPGTVTLTTDTATILARVPVTATLEDDDGPSGITWRWSRSPNGRTGWVNIAGATSATYTPTLEEDAGNYIRATASYTDGEEPNRTKTANAVSARVGDPPPVNSAPAFPSTENGQREAPEDATGGTPIGNPVEATDLNAGDSAVNDPLAYSLSGTEAASFTIDGSTGQLRLASGVTLDFETKRSHRFTVQVTDGADQHGDDDMDAVDDTINVTVTVTNVNEAPMISGDDAPSFQENSTSAVGTYTGADPERDTLTWSVSGNDFWISSRGQLYFRTPPSFEGQPSYQVTVTATDDDETTPLSGSLAVTVTVTDAEEEGVVAITPPRGWVNEQTQFSADLTDDDGGVNDSSTTWQWARSSSGRSSWEDIADATLSSYTAGANDLNQYLQATASYEDSRGGNKTASVALKTPVGDVRPTTNTDPTFTETSPVTRTVQGGTAAGRNVGAPVRATDTDQGDILTYSLQSGADADAFDIDAATGQIRTKDVLDSDVKDTYEVTVSVHDGFNSSYSPSTASDATIAVTITVTAAPVVVRRPPTGGGGSSGGGGGGGGFTSTAAAPVFGEGSRTSRSLPETAQPGEDVGAPVSARDARGEAVTYTLAGTDAALFTVDGSTGQILVASGAVFDYERKQRTYEVDVRARSSGSRTATIRVVIRITNVELTGVAKEYDRNGDELIDFDEAIAAVADYFDGIISRDDATTIVILYFQSPASSTGGQTGNEGSTS